MRSTRIPRLYVPHPLGVGMEVPLEADQAHYLARVMRCGVGGQVVVFNGRDGEWLSRISGLGRQPSLAVERLVRPQVAGADLWLVFALLKRTATDILLQKATELGVRALMPVVTARSEPERFNAERAGRILREAAEQCERLDVPALAAPRRLADVLADWPSGRILHAAVERRRGAKLRPAGGPSALLIGPEGGFAPAELDALGAHAFVLPATLGPLVLRAETAAIAGLALLQADETGSVGSEDTVI